MLDLSIIDLLALAQQDTTLKKTASTNGGEYVGPCPICGGNDRFHVWPNHPSGSGRFWCRKCDIKGNAIDYLQKVRNLPFSEALAVLNIPNPYQPQQSNGNGNNQSKQTVTTAYTYHDASGVPIYQVVRFDNPKEYKPRRMDGRWGYVRCECC